MMKKSLQKNKGFTLIEIVVASAIFVIVMVVAVGAVLSAVDANRKAQTLSSITNNLSFAIESMIRDMRTGKDYALCPTGGTACMQFEDRNADIVKYSFSGGIINKEVNGSPLGSISGVDVTLEDVSFIIRGSGSTDGPQRILFQIKGYAGADKTKSNFNIQTLITSRTLDLIELQ